jgi:hypothetical protein
MIYEVIDGKKNDVVSVGVIRGRTRTALYIQLPNGNIGMVSFCKKCENCGGRIVSTGEAKKAIQKRDHIKHRGEPTS